MHTSTLPVLLLSLALCVSAASLWPLPGRRVLPVSRPPNGRAFVKRQVTVGLQSPLPSQCTSTCSPVSSEVSLGCPVTACCTTAFETQYYNCLECIGTALNVANYSSAQTDLNLLYMTCVDIGFVLPPMALPGQPASGSNSSAVSSSSPSGSATAPFPTGPGATPSASGARATRAALGVRWSGVWAEALIGAVIFLGVTAL